MPAERLRNEEPAVPRCQACGGALGAEAVPIAVDRLHGTPGRFSVAACATCGSGLTLPPAAPEELARFYPGGYGPYESPAGWAALASAAIQRVQARRGMSRPPLDALAARRPGSALDVGCGRGDLAVALGRRGWSVTGIDPSAAACAAARARGVDAREGTLATMPLEPGAYDAASFQHSLEHVATVPEDLAAVRAALAPGGVVAITVPNFDGWQRRRFGSRWFHLDVPRHRVHFTPAGLTAALEQAGLQPVRLTTSTSTIGLPASVQYRLLGRCLFPDGLSLRVAAGAAAATYPLARALDRMHDAGGDLLHAVARRAD